MEASLGIEGKDAGYKNSVGLEVLAIFGIASFVVRIAVDIAQRVRNGRSFKHQQSLLGGLTRSVLSMINTAARLYDHRSDTR